MRRLLLLGLALAAAGASAQPRLTTPEASPHARTVQTVGITELAVDYHRPAVAGRVVWGDLVPYHAVWRAGANDNTVFETSTAISVEGHPLPAGRYGVHAIPTETSWIVAFSHFADAWGSYSYDEAEDALRVTVEARPAPFGERLAWRFDNPTETAADLVLHWERLEVPVRITVDTPALVLAGMERELRGVAGFYAEPWAQIAEYALQHGLRTEEALAWAERSLEMEATFGARMTRAGLLDALGRPDEAAAARDQAFAEASPDDVRAYARAQRRAGRTADADAALARLEGQP